MSQLNEQFLRKVLDDIDDKILSRISIELSADIRTELENTLKKSLEIVEKTNLKDTIEFSLWTNVWNQYGIYGESKLESRNKFSSKTYSRGRLLLIDFGQHNIGLEFSMEHMGVVIKDFDGLLEVVPVTSDHGQIFNKNVENVIIRVKKEQYPQFKNDSILLVHQTQSIGRNRIVKDIFQSIANTPLMELLEEKISRTYSPFNRKKLLDEIQKLKEENETKKQMIKHLEEMLKKKIGVEKEILPAN